MGPGAFAGARFRASQAAGAGVVLEPAQATGFGFAGSVVSFTQTVTNQTGVESDLTLSLAGNAWPAALAIQWAYADALSGGGIAVIDTGVNRIVKTIPMPQQLRDMALFPPPAGCFARAYLPVVMRRYRQCRRGGGE